MKKSLLLLTLIVVSLLTIAQVPESINYQAVLRDSDGNIKASQNIDLEVSILQGSSTGSRVCYEQFNVTTNQFGLINLQIGSVNTTDFSLINWSNGSHFVNITIDNVDFGTSQLLSVPFALHAKTAESITGTITENDPDFNSWDKSTGISVSESQINDLQSYLSTEVDPSFSNWDKASGIVITENQISDLQGYLTEETDPTFIAWNKSTGVSITESQITDLQAYLSAEIDPEFTNWDKTTGIVIKENQISDLQGYLTEETDPIYGASIAKGITAEDTTNWNKNAATLPTAEAGNMITYDGTNWLAKDLAITTENTGNNTPISIMPPYTVVRYVIIVNGLFPSRSFDDAYLGVIRLVTYNFDPRNTLGCDGQLLAISQYTALFALMGTSYGGDGRSTFGLPDLRGRIPLGEGNGPGLTPRVSGQKGGSETITLNTVNLPAHNHTVTISYED
jgi:microcystin-dependent protein